MKRTRLLATLIATTLPLAAIVAEDAGKTETTDQKKGQGREMMRMNTITDRVIFNLERSAVGAFIPCLFLEDHFIVDIKILEGRG
jgi:hypothetical protein